MNHKRRTDETAIGDALNACAERVELASPLRWLVSIAKGATIAVDARVEGGWLLFSAPGGAPPADWLAVAGLNRGLEASSRIAMAVDTGLLQLRAEVQIGEGINLDDRVREACAGLVRASQRLAGTDPAGDPGGKPADGSAVALADGCREAGWSFVERRSGTLAIDLDVVDASHQATLAPAGPSGCTLGVGVAQWDSARPACRQALGVFLLSAAGALRFVRPAATVNGEVVAGFEVAFGARPAARELDEALRALSAACRLFAREAQLLRDEGVATRFLGLRDPGRRWMENAEINEEVGSWN